MKKGILLAMILSMTLVVSAAASPGMLGKGHKSLGFRADTQRPTIDFGWNIGEMTKFQIGGGWTNTEPETPEGTSVDSETTWNMNIGISRYMTVMDSDTFAPFVGANVIIQDQGPSRDTSFGARGFFGVEAFVIEQLSFGGNIGISYIQEGNRTVTAEGAESTIEGKKTLTTASSAIMATIYW